MARTKGTRNTNSDDSSPSPSPTRSPSPPSPPATKPLSSPPLFDSTPPPTKETTPFVTPPQSPLNNSTEPIMQDGYLTTETTPEKTPLKNNEELPFIPDPESFHPLAMVLYVEPKPTSVKLNLNTPRIVVEDQPTAPQEPPNLNKMAPHLRNITKRKLPPKKAKSAPNPRPRKSQRLRSAVGTKKTNSVDTTVHEISDSDEETEPTTPLAEKTPSPLKPKPKSNKKVSKPPIKVSVPKPKPKPTVKDKGKQKQTAQPERSPERSSESLSDKDYELSTDYSPECSPKRKNPSKQKIIHISTGKRVPLFDPSLKKDFKEKWGNRSIGIGRYYDFVKLEKDKVVLKEYVDEQGWTKFLQLRERHYPKLVQTFYFMAEAYPEESLIVSRIKEVEIRLTPQVISDTLGISNSGQTVFGDDWFEKLEVNYENVYKLLFKPNVTEFVSSNLLPTPKMLNGISQHCVLPRNGNFQHVSSNDLLVMYHLLMKEKLSLPHIIIHNMINVIQSRNKKSCLPYGMALTKIFIKNHIPFEGEKSVFEYSQFTPKNLSHMKQEPVDEPPSDLKRKREDGSDLQNPVPENASDEHCNPPERSPVMEEDQELLENFGNHASLSKVKASEILQSFTEKTPITKPSKLFISPQKHDYSALFQSDSVDKFFVPQAFDSSVQMDSLKSLQTNLSFPSRFNESPSMAQRIFEHNERPTKRSKVEKDCSKTRSDLTRVIEGNNAILHYLSWMTFEMSLSRKWKDSISDKNEFARPEQNPFPVPMYPMFMPTISSSSDASSPTIPPTAAAAPFHDDKGGDDLGDYELGGPGKQLGSREE
ncbi:hypothetical protein MTR_5g059190 [Medicago truncatula]|uniref:Putative plant transposon protein domain-containing protein n=1 Tax=Medicago truncatula TaxID=3880 RepID=G7K8X3_MEDTR|nr:hypothetical protein MTR_5g059190 [Medicago truncatula]